MSPVAEEFVLRALASVTPQPLVLFRHTPRSIGEAAGQLGFDWYYESAAERSAAAVWGILCDRDLAFEDALDMLCALRPHITDGGWVIVTIDDAGDGERWASDNDRRHPALESRGFALAADVECESQVLTTIVRNLAREAGR